MREYGGVDLGMFEGESCGSRRGRSSTPRGGLTNSHDSALCVVGAGRSWFGQHVDIGRSGTFHAVAKL